MPRIFHAFIDGQKSKCKFVETLNYMKEGAIFNYTRLTNYTCKILQHYFAARKVGHKRGNRARNRGFQLAMQQCCETSWRKMLPILPYLYVQSVTVVLLCCFYLARFSFCYLTQWPWLLAASTNCYLCLKYSYNFLYWRKWKRPRFFKRGFMFNLMISFSYGSNLLYLSR